MTHSLQRNQHEAGDCRQRDYTHYLHNPLSTKSIARSWWLPIETTHVNYLTHLSTKSTAWSWGLPTVLHTILTSPSAIYKVHSIKLVTADRETTQISYVTLTRLQSQQHEADYCQQRDYTHYLHDTQSTKETAWSCWQLTEITHNTYITLSCP